MNAPFLPARVYQFLFALLGLVYITGLFVPLADNDAAHHASIALRMYLTGDYVSLVDQGGDYLDKPHLLFWLSAFSFKLFGVNSFAYKFPTLLFTLLGTYSTYRMGKTLYGREAGKLSALIAACAFAYILANTDVRMDGILTASIAFASWQLIEFILHKKILNTAGAALGLALGFSAKGHIGVFVPAITAFFFILYRKDWKIFLNWKWIALLILFGLFISPVVYCYYLQYNLHPEKTVRGRNHINGVNFILFNQSIDRFNGRMGGDAGNDHFFFLHSFLWAFAPWSILTYLAVAGRIKNFFQRKEEWGTTVTFIIVAIVVSFSGFKLPHYLNVVFPAAAVITSVFILSRQSQPRWIKTIFTIQFINVIILLLLSAFINAWAFPVKKIWIIIAVILLLALVFYFVRSRVFTPLQKAVAAPAAAIIFSFFLLNSSFYPQLLTYQAGQNLAELTKGKVDPAHVYTRLPSYSASYTFYTQSLFKKFDDSLLNNGKKVWVVTEPGSLEQLKNDGYQTGTIWAATHFRTTKLSFKFLNPSTRQKECSEMMLVEITGKYKSE